MDDFLEDYQELWNYISQNGLSYYPCSWDCYLEPVEEDDYCGYNFSGDNRVMMIFFTGASDYFPAIKCGTANSDLDKYPVYIYDLESDTPEDPTGLNFKQYIKSILNDALKGGDRIDEIEEALDDVEQFSDELLI